MEESTLQVLLDALEGSLPSATSLAESLPPPSDLAFERTLSRPLARALTAETSRIHTLVDSILRWAHHAPASNSQPLDGEMVLEGVYGPVIDALEPLLEGVDVAIDTHLGLGKPKNVVAVPVAPRASTSKDRPLAPHLVRADVAKPQLLFPPDLRISRPPLPDPTDSQEPLWKPVMRSKPNGTLSDSWLRKETFTPPLPKPTSSDPFPPVLPTRTRYAHPFADELAALTPPPSYFVSPDVPPPVSKSSFEETPFEYIEDVDGLTKLVNELQSDEHKELAVDLEHHDLRTWSGITCLMQLSSRSKDYVVDVLNPSVRNEIQVLNQFFTDPSWIKVFHGARSDIIWLQRDLGLYVVGLFDTYIATHVLDLPQHSLAYLLEQYTGFKADKRYQLADWRIRPLPKEMLFYARSDTHFLLQVYDHVRLALAALPAPPLEEPSPLQRVFERSTTVSSAVFEILPYDSTTGLGLDGWRSLMVKWRVLPPPTSTSLQEASSSFPSSTTTTTGWEPGGLKFEILRAVHTWRENLARELDESLRWVMSNEAIRLVAERAPVDDQLWDAALGRMNVIGEGVRTRKKEVMEIVRNTIDRLEKDANQEDAIIVDVDVKMDEQESSIPIDPPQIDRPSSSSFGTNLWTTGEGATTSTAVAPRATNSLFFGRAQQFVANGTSKLNSLFAGSSSFFGTLGSKDDRANGVDAGMSKSSRRDTVARIHNTLQLGTGLSSKQSTLRTQTVPGESPSTSIPGPGSLKGSTKPSNPTSLDHLFVSKAERQLESSSSSSSLSMTTTIKATTTTAETIDKKEDDDDVIIVSTLSDKTPKKRKRPHKQQQQQADVKNVMETVEEERVGSQTNLLKQKKKESSQSPPPPQQQQQQQQQQQIPLQSPSPKKKLKKVKTRTRVEPFDYSKTPSILDKQPAPLPLVTTSTTTTLMTSDARDGEDSNAASIGQAKDKKEEEGEEKKKKTKTKKKKSGGGVKGFSIDTSAFPRPPRQMNESKKGEMSRSFAN